MCMCGLISSVDARVRNQGYKIEKYINIVHLDLSVLLFQIPCRILTFQNNRDTGTMSMIPDLVRIPPKCLRPVEMIEGNSIQLA